MLRSLEETVHLRSWSASERLTRLSDEVRLQSHMLAMEHKAATSRIATVAGLEANSGAAAAKFVVCGLACVLDIVLVVVTGGTIPPVLSSIYSILNVNLCSMRGHFLILVQTSQEPLR
ncbi:hypothetical protein PHLGIDRAFT_202633 [Phlebiopsis gigantea 11061_1 CR5-6]|uniref:Uncharacterized protein n=1 Tax=Phlebiopsis gigantea (strain 11061_1 CR5-6) TaxID=745531 RepID=A0A0C3S3A8_PHLG1|nr:hypothetical protein PHLGIDRAFT_202633 [Phlebiopsis gigantea 11061_1 CR5-6]